MSDNGGAGGQQGGQGSGDQQPNGSGSQQSGQQGGQQQGSNQQQGGQQPGQQQAGGQQGRQQGSTSGDGAPGPDASVEEWKAYARKWERQSKSNSEAATELQQIKDAQLSEVEREKKRADALDAELKAAKLQNLRTEVALAKNLPPQMAARLTGNTREDLEHDADELLALIGNSNGKSRTADPRLGAGQGGGRPQGDWLREQLQGR